MNNSIACRKRWQSFRRPLPFRETAPSLLRRWVTRTRSLESEIRHRKQIEDLRKRSQKEYVTPFDVAIVYVGLNDRDEAFRWLEQAYDERAMRLEQITEPAFDPLRSDPRLTQLEKRIGLSPR